MLKTDTLKALDFEILRDVISNGRVSVPLERMPLYVAILVDETAFLQDQHLVHHRTVFLVDRMHDWNWEAGRFRYYGGVADKADVLVVFETQDVQPVIRFDPHTGAPVRKEDAPLPTASAGCARQL